MWLFYQNVYVVSCGTMADVGEEAQHRCIVVAQTLCDEWIVVVDLPTPVAAAWFDGENLWWSDL